LINIEKAKTSKNGKRVLQVTRRDLEEYFSHSTGYHDVYQCPVCPELVNNSEFDGCKLYINNNKNLGYCFRCETVFVYEESYNLEFEAKEFEKKTKIVEIPNTQYDMWYWTHPISALLPEHPIMTYLKTERKYQHSMETLSAYNVRWCDMGNKSVLIFPNELDDKGQTNFFQYKVLGGTRKYITICPPPIMWLETSISNSGKLTLVEGVFDALAVGGACMCGKTLSDMQQQQLREFCLNTDFESILLMLDGDVPEENCRKKAEEVKKIAGGKLVSYMILPDNLDPEEAMGVNFNFKNNIVI